MSETIPHHIDDQILSTFLNRLQDIFAAMDREYARAAARYQFDCDGCRDNCCRTRFHHHTYLEYFYLGKGIERMDPRKKDEIIARAIAVEKKMPLRLMCPLNDDSLCMLYPFRPMICRLHGIPHELKKPGQNAIRVTGCDAFDERCAGQDYIKFDRTPFYTAMAGLENEFKQAAGLEGRIKMTLAEMVLTMVKKHKD